MADIEGLNEFINELNNISTKVDNIITNTLEETATKIVASTQLNTPVLTGNLRRSWTHDNVKKDGDKYSINVGSSLEYAKPVEEGHRTKNGTFVQGRFMLRDAITQNENNIQNKIDQELNKI